MAKAKTRRVPTVREIQKELFQRMNGRSSRENPTSQDPPTNEVRHDTGREWRAAEDNRAVLRKGAERK